MDDQFCQGVLIRSMCITQTNLLPVFLVQAHLRAVEVFDEIFEAHPEDAIDFAVIEAELLVQVLFQFFGGVLPLELPLALVA